MTERKKNLIRWALAIAGFIGTLLVFAPSQNGVTIKADPPAVPLRAPDATFPISEPVPREAGLGFAQPFLFALADTDKMTGVERERQLKTRYLGILDQLDGERIPTITVNSDLGSAMVVIFGKTFVTVLPQDCPEYFGRLDEEGQKRLEEEVAYSWARVIQEDLEIQTVKRHPLYLRLFNCITFLTFFLACMVHLTITWVSKRFFKSPLWSLKLLLWVMYFTVLTNLHPSLDGLAHVLSRAALEPIINGIFIAVAVGLLHQATQYAIRNYMTVLSHYDKEDSLRADLRRQTLEQAWTFVSKVTWSFLGLCLFLKLSGVDLGQFFAGAGLIGVGLGVMARDVFVDFFSGANILAEDQFGVGDWIEANGETGEVVAFSLRSTKIRKTDGSLATISNSDLRRVKNHSNEYSVVDFRVTVTYDTDTDQAMAIIMDEIALLETEWQGKMVSPPDALGIDELGGSGITLRVTVRTVPLAQWATHRKLARRVKLRFDEEGIKFAGA